MVNFSVVCLNVALFLSVCVHVSVEGVSQFGLLELSESQGVFDEERNRESCDDDVEVVPASRSPAEDQKATIQSKSQFR